MKIKAFITVSVVFLIVYSLYLFSPETVVSEIRHTNFFDVLEWLTLSSFISVLILLFFCNKIFTSWFKSFYLWFTPLTFVFSLIGGSESFLQLSSENLAILTGEIMVVVTLVFALVQRFYYHVK